jgi:hypothetical protein
MGISGRIAKFFMHSQMTPLLALVAVLLGIFSVLVTPREEEPQINVTMANVLIAYPGASSQDVARTVSTPAEQVLSQIAGAGMLAWCRSRAWLCFRCSSIGEMHGPPWSNCTMSSIRADGCAHGACSR